MIRAPHVLLIGSAAVFATSSGLLVAGQVFHSERTEPHPR
jgi:hypothetical protein